MEEQMHNIAQSRDNNISNKISGIKVSWDMMSREALCAVRQWNKESRILNPIHQESW